MSKEADEVFEFLDSLPQDKTDAKGNNASNDKGTNQGKGKDSKDEDILDFLDELEKTNIKKVTGADDKKMVKEMEKQPIEDEPVIVDQTKDNEKNAKSDKDDSAYADEKSNIRESSEPLNDPITSISNWWSSSGSTKVSSIWSKTTEHANILKDRVVKEATNTNLPPINNLINNQQINDIVKNLQKIVVGDTDEVLRIHLVHDLINLPQLTYEFHDKFDQVLSSQVQGGIRIFVDEWGKPNDSMATNTNDNGELVKNDNIQLNVFQGKSIDAEKLSFANLDESIKLFNKAHDEIMKQQKQQKQDQEGNKDDKDIKENVSDLFISIAPVTVPETTKDSNSKEDIQIVDSIHPGCFSFTIILKDITNNINIITKSQGYPMKWVEWLENNKLNVDKQENGEDVDVEDIDPSEWVHDWIMDGLNLAIGVLAQSYVVERMGYN